MLQKQRTHQIVSESTSETDEDECNSSDNEEESDDSSEEKEGSDLSYWDPNGDCYRNKRTHQVVSENTSETDENKENNSTKEESEDDDPSEEEYVTNLSHWEHYSNRCRNKRANQIIPKSDAEKDEGGECSSSDNEENNKDSSEEKKRTSLNSWDPDDK